MTVRLKHFLLGAGVTSFILVFFWVLAFHFQIVGLRSKFIGTNRVSATGPFVFTAGGDWGGTTNSQLSTDAILASGANFHLMIGDLSYNDIQPESAWCDFIKSRVGANFPFELLAGNHEVDDGPQNGNINNFISCLPDHLGNIVGTYGKEYYFDYQNLARFILISPDLLMDGESYDYFGGVAPTSHYLWLSSAIDDARAHGIPWVIVAMHKVCLSAGVKGCEVGTDVVNLLVSKKVDLVLEGHEHNYQRSRQLVFNGASCLTLSNSSYNSTCVVDDGAGANHVYTQGSGTVFVIAGTGGRPLDKIFSTAPDGPYFVSSSGSNLQPQHGIMKFTVSDTRIDGQFVPSTPESGFTDSFSLAQGTRRVLTFTPTDDTTIFKGQPAKVSGTASTLQVDNSPIVHTLLKFLISGTTGKSIVSAKLRWANIDSSPVGGEVHRAGNDSWTEATTSWNNAPTLLSPIIATIGAVSGTSTVPKWYEADVTSAVVGDGLVSFRIRTTSADLAKYISKEGAVGSTPNLAVTVQ